MQSRRSNDYSTTSPSAKAPIRGRIKLDYDQYPISQHWGELARSPRDRSLSPGEMGLVGDRTNCSFERQEYDRRVQSRSPLYRQRQERSHFDEDREIMHRNSEYVGTKFVLNSVNEYDRGLPRAYEGSDYSARCISRGKEERDYSDRGISRANEEREYGGRGVFRGKEERDYSDHGISRTDENREYSGRGISRVKEEREYSDHGISRANGDRYYSGHSIIRVKDERDYSEHGMSRAHKKRNIENENVNRRYQYVGTNYTLNHVDEDGRVVSRIREERDYNGHGISLARKDRDEDGEFERRKYDYVGTDFVLNQVDEDDAGVSRAHEEIFYNGYGVSQPHGERDYSCHGISRFHNNRDEDCEDVRRDYEYVVTNRASECEKEDDCRASHAYKERDYGEKRIVHSEGRSILGHKFIPVEEGNTNRALGLECEKEDDRHASHTHKERDYGENRIVASEDILGQKSIPMEEGTISWAWKCENEDDRRVSQARKESECAENRIKDSDGGSLLGQTSIPMEKGTVRGSYQLPPDLVPSDYADIGYSTKTLSEKTDIGQIKNERLQCRETPLLDEQHHLEAYKGNKHIQKSRDGSYPVWSTSHSKGFVNSSHDIDAVGSSSGILRSDIAIIQRDGMPFPASEEYSRRNRRYVLSVSDHASGERPFKDSMSDTKLVGSDIASYHQGAYDDGAEHEDKCYIRPGEAGKSGNTYSSDGVHRRIRAPVDYDSRNLSEPSGMHDLINTFSGNEDHYRNMRESHISNNPSLQKEMVSEYLDMLRQDGEFQGYDRAHGEFGKRILLESDLSRLDASQRFNISHESPIYMYDSEVRALDSKTQRMKEEEYARFEKSERRLKRKYIEEDVSRPHSESQITSMRNVPEEFEDLYGSEELMYEDMTGINSSRSGRSQCNEYRKGGTTYNRQEGHPVESRSANWLPPQNSLRPAQRPSNRSYKHNEYVKGYQRPSSINRNSIKSHHFGKRLPNYKQHNNVWKRNDEDMHENSNDIVGNHHAERAPFEASEKFKAKVFEAFLKYSKKLNMHPGVRKRYKEQGQAGSLFCAVCGNSNSKEFMDTRGLVTHAYMSHKIGFRAEHLGLYKAICVLLGWNSGEPRDTITWIPECLPDIEASAAKEDLIIWPPIIIVRNLSMSNNSPKEQKVVPITAIEAFIREAITGEGFVCGKISLGRPSDQSVVVIKFMGTFSGLSNAERLNKYFAERKRGRKDFVGNKDKIDINIGEGEKLEERLLYGYMGIAEDLDRVDSSTKQFCTIKSKKGIQELADGPVKPDDR